MKIYTTTFCNQAHRVEDGKPIAHRVEDGKPIAHQCLEDIFV